MNKKDVYELCISPLRKVFSDGIRMLEEDGSAAYLILDGSTEKFFLNFMYDGRIDTCWKDERFIFDKGRNLLTSEDTFHEIVYEDSAVLSDHNMLANTIVQLLEVLNNSVLVSKQEIDTGEMIPSGYVKKKKYIINLSKSGFSQNEWEFGNSVKRS